jgi:hypothetical protein
MKIGRSGCAATPRSKVAMNRACLLTCSWGPGAPPALRIPCWPLTSRDEETGTAVCCLLIRCARHLCGQPQRGPPLAGQRPHERSPAERSGSLRTQRAEPPRSAPIAPLLKCPATSRYGDQTFSFQRPYRNDISHYREHYLELEPGICRATGPFLPAYLVQCRA